MGRTLRGTCALLGVALLGVVGCDDSSSSSSGAPADPADGGAFTTPDGSAPGADGSAPDGGGPGAGCPVSSNVYAVAGNNLFRTTPDLTVSEIVAQVISPKDQAPLSGTVLFAKAGGTELIVSAQNCPVCRVDPTAVKDKKVTAELLRDDLFPAALADSGAPQTVILIGGQAGAPNYSAFNTSTITVGHSPKIPVAGPGQSCNKVMDVEGVITDDLTYDFYFLAECSDGSVPPSAMYLHTSGTFTEAPFTSTQLKHEVIAWAKNSASNYAVEKMHQKLGVFRGSGKQVLKVGGAQDFVLDTRTFYQCGALGQLVPGSIPIF